VQAWLTLRSLLRRCVVMASLLDEKAAFAKAQGIEACTNPQCGCTVCTCGAGCTCGVSPAVVCDPCVDFKQKKAAAAQLQEGKSKFAAEQGIEVCSNPLCGCESCTCGPGCTCGVSLAVTCDPCVSLVAARKEFKAAQMKALNAERLAAARSLFAEKIKPNFEDVPGISAAELRDALQSAEPPLLIDCRSQAERSVSTLRGSVPMHLEQQAKEARPMVAFCGIGGRAGKFAAELLQVNPDAKIKNFELSLIEWCHIGGELVHPDTQEPTDDVHTFTEEFSTMFPASGYKLTW